MSSDQSDRFDDNFEGPKSKEVLATEIFNCYNANWSYLLPKEKANLEKNLHAFLTEWRSRFPDESALEYFSKFSGGKVPKLS